MEALQSVLDYWGILESPEMLDFDFFRMESGGHGAIRALEAGLAAGALATAAAVVATNVVSGPRRPQRVERGNRAMLLRVWNGSIRVAEGSEISSTSPFSFRFEMAHCALQ